VFGKMAADRAIDPSTPRDSAEPRLADLKGDLERVSSARIYFGHQSVGNNVLDGFRALAIAEGVALRIVEAPTGLDDDLPGIVHAKVGKNRAPTTKCEAFCRALVEHSGRWDAALLKFCYADLGDAGERDPSRLLYTYNGMVASMRSARPDLVVVHATSPLLSDGLGKRDAIRKALGFGTSNDEGNRIRNEFNDLLRAKYANDPIFDVARAESTRRDGTRSGFFKGARFFETMAREFTYDEGHLTATGSTWVAREFARSLAQALGEPPEP
jgi:hypothetical protein